VNQVARQKDDLFVCEINSCITSIPFRCITYFEVMDREILLHHIQHKDPICFYATMGQLEKDLSAKDFLRIHRSYLVHLPFIAKFASQKLVLSDKTQLPIGRNYMESVKKHFCDYIFQNNIYAPKGEIKL
jgi:two-component system response regulator LytT